MKKKLISLCTAFALTALSVSPVHAASFDELKSAILDYLAIFDQNLLTNIRNGYEISVDTDIEHKKATDAVYIDEEIIVPVSDEETVVNFDYKAKMSLESVRTKANFLWTAAQLAIDHAHPQTIPGTDTAENKALKEQLANMIVDGEFTVKITYPDSVTVPEYMIAGVNPETSTKESMIGFNEGAKQVFYEDPNATTRTLTEDVDGNNVLSIAIKTKAPGSTADAPQPLLGGVLCANDASLENLLADITLECKGLNVKGIKTHIIKGEVTGYTNIGDEVNTLTSVSYTAVQVQDGPDNGETEIYEKVTLAAPTEAPTTTPTPTPSTPGGNDSNPVGFLPLGGGGPIVTPAPTPEGGEIIPADPETDVELNKDDHYAYIIGYPEGDVRPEGNITRAEVATIFFRIMGDASREKYATSENNYSDVELGQWYNNAISTATAAGIVNGYEDGTFRPDNAITRAEFATIAARFISGRYEGSNMFGDIDGHWAAEYINRACKYGWINGYGDGTFVPDKNITRAEAMTLVNTVLGRKTDPDKMHDDMVDWIDNEYGMWYYAAVQEATNPHTYTRDDAGVETWTAVMENRDWKALETEVFGAKSE